jgi:hypothetical protein
MRNFDNTHGRRHLIIWSLILLAIICVSVRAEDFEDNAGLLQLRGSYYWRGITDFAVGDSMMYAVYRSGLAIYRPQPGFLGIDTVALVALSQPYEKALKLKNEILLYNPDGKIGFVFVKNPDNPKIQGEADLKTDFYELAYHRLNVYLACGFEGIKVYNFENRDNPYYETTLEEPAHAVAIWVYKNLLYVIDDYNGIYIYDLQNNPDRPEFVGSSLFEHPLKDIFCTGDRAYAAYSDSGTAVIDLTDPLNPELIRTWDTETSVIGVEPVGEYILARDVYGDFEVYHPDNPSRINLIEAGEMSGHPCFISDYAGEYLLWADSELTGNIYKIIPGWNLAKIGEVGRGDNLGQIELQDGMAFVSSGVDPLLRLKISFDYGLSPLDDYPARMDAVARYENLLFIADNSDRLIWIIRVVSPSVLSTVGYIPLEDEALGIEVAMANDAASLNLVAYLSNGVFLHNLDLETAFLYSSAEIILESPLLAGDMYGDFLYILMRNNGFALYMIGEPFDPQWVGEVDMPAGINSFEVIESRFYTAGEDGLTIYNRVNGYPESIEMFFNEVDKICRFVRTDTLIYCSAGDDGLLVLREWGSDSLTLAESYQTPGYAAHIAAEDSLVLVSDSYGLLVFALNQSGEQPQPEPGSVPRHFSLAQNYPNPFNQSTLIPVDITQDAADLKLEIAIYNGLGQRVRVLVNTSARPGRHYYEWDGRDDAGKDLASGLYLYRCRVGGLDLSRKMMLLK